MHLWFVQSGNIFFFTYVNIVVMTQLPLAHTEGNEKNLLILELYSLCKMYEMNTESYFDFMANNFLSPLPC